MPTTGKDWDEERVFPKHETKESPYSLGFDHGAFHEAVLDYCLDVVQGAGSDQNRQRLAFWGTLALMRCVGSSPAAALSALRNRFAADGDKLGEQVFDEDGEDEDAVDLEPAAGLDVNDPLARLIKQAEQLATAPDPKIKALVGELKPLVDMGANPVAFCRFIATAEHVGQALRKAFPKLRVEVITGALTAEERRDRVESMSDADQRILVATDCLSEGINLQGLFDTVIHYDLSWNPTRHQQREGRVDRFGQPAPLVRSILLFSPDSAIDGAVLDVILRKAEAIRKATGVTVPLPDERGAVTGALMNAVLLRKGSRKQQLTFDFGEETRSMEANWRDAEEGEKRSRARFAQNAIKPEEVAPEWKRWRELLGDSREVQRFAERAFKRLNAPLDPTTGQTIKAHLKELPAALGERLQGRGFEGTVRVSFAEPVPPRTDVLNRSHPIVATIADYLLESALDHRTGELPLGRAGAWTNAAVQELTTIALLRLRFKLVVHGRKEQMLLVEEANAIAFDHQGNVLATGELARALLEPEAPSNLAPIARDRMIVAARERVKTALSGVIAEYARSRAEALAEDHARVREAGINVSRVTVKPVLPVDVIGLFVLVPAGI